MQYEAKSKELVKLTLKKTAGDIPEALKLLKDDLYIATCTSEGYREFEQFEARIILQMWEDSLE